MTDHMLAGYLLTGMINAAIVDLTTMKTKPFWKRFLMATACIYLWPVSVVSLFVMSRRSR